MTVCLAFISCFGQTCFAQETAPAPAPAASSEQVADKLTGQPASSRLERHLFRDLAGDQVSFWTAPFRTRRRDIAWVLPAAGITAGLIYKDVDLSRDFELRPSRARFSRNLSDAGLFATGGVVAGSYLWGTLTKNEHLRETGWLAGEAMANSYIVGSALKYSLRRKRPFSGTDSGNFFHGGDSFPSNHALMAWSAASVFAHEYPGPLTKTLFYGLASAVSAARVTGGKHFPSDVAVGSALGWMLGRQVYRARHDEELGGVDIGRIVPDGETRRYSGTFVPLDSWIYPAIDRAAGLGYAHSALQGTRPWTRSEVRRITEEIGEELFEAGDLADEEVKLIHQRLRNEVRPETGLLQGGTLPGFVVDSVYFRSTGIGGTPLRDSLHFGQTLENDSGRPYGEGFNGYAGFAARAHSGPFSIFVRAEYQHATVGPVPDATARLQIAEADAVASGRDPNLFLPPAVPYSGQDRVRLLEAYGTWSAGNWSVSVGNQSLSWGAGSSPLLMGRNAEPITMIRISNPEPARLPWIFGLMGPVRTEYFFGRLRGHRLLSPEFREPAVPVKQPFMQGQRISFKPTPNLEIGFGRTAIFGGNRFPLTTRSLVRSLFSPANETGPNDPGDRRSSFDFSYRLPGLRKWVTLYSDSLADDEISPIAYPRRSAIAPGIYISHLPQLPKLDFRAEGAYTNLPGLRDEGFFYFNQRYRSGYTNNGNLIGNPVGRQGYSVRVESTYWFSPLTTLGFSYLTTKTDKTFLGGGGQQTLAAKSNYLWNDRVYLQGILQYQRWNFPVLQPAPTANVAVSLQLTYRPK